MRYLGIAAFLASVLVAGSLRADSEAREPNYSDFTPEYLEQVRDERQSEESKQKDRKEHAKFLRDLAHIDRIVPD